VLTNNFSAEYGLTGSGIILHRVLDLMKPLEKFSSLQDLDHLLMENPALHRDLSGNQVKNGFAYQVGAGWRSFSEK
jgi:hypothetical protein